MAGATLPDGSLIELFHLSLLRLLPGLVDKREIVVKGGANLRFFFGSPRHSEDIDFDVGPKLATHRLADAVAKVLGGKAMATLLLAHGVRVGRVSAPKQTETTQRWKVGLVAADRGIELPTKLEFSHRGIEGELGLDPVDAAVARRYGVTPPLACHYRLSAAIAQKVRALAGRAVPQARDVFDLDVLLARAGRDVARHLGDLGPKIGRAADRALEFSYDDFAAQVLAFLPPDERQLLEGRQSWEAMQLRVAEALGREGR